MKIAYIGYQIQEKYNNGTTRDEDQELFDFLQKKGLNIQREVWNNQNVSWTDYDAVVLKSPWDYHEKIEEFEAWINHLNEKKVKMYNSAEKLIWNTDKHYLKDISEAGFPTIKTIYLEKDSSLEKDLFDVLKTEILVVKPCVSAGSKNTILVSKEDFDSKFEEVNIWLKEEAYMIQPFVKQISEGEWSLLFFGGKYSHSLLKTPKDQDFRVQHYLGGKIHYTEANENLRAQAQKIVDVFAQNELYARVDGVLIDDVFHLMELEMIEPYLFLDGNENHMENYYQALIKNENF